MTKTAAKEKKTQDAQQVLPGLQAAFAGLCQRGILGVLLVSLSVLTFLGFLGHTSGILIDWWCGLLLRGLGWGSYVVVLAAAALGVLSLLGRVSDLDLVPWRIIVGAEIVFVALIGLMHLLFAGDDPWGAAQAGRAGGYVGAVFGGVLSEALGLLPAGVILGVVLGWGILVISGETFEEWTRHVEERLLWAWRCLETLPPKLRAWLSSAQARLSAERPAEETAAETIALDTPAVEESEPAPEIRRQRRYHLQLPPLGLLDMPSKPAVDGTEVRERARLIEETLGQFGVPAKVVETNWGPMVTQFGVEPGYVTRRGYDGEETERKIRVAKIASLSDDLALVLAAAPIRIEAPVPGRSIVGIEVPNSQVSLVSLRKVMSSKAFRRRSSALRLALGEGVAGTPVVADLAKMPHLLIAGATGSGKSVCINAIAMCLLFQNSPLTLRLVMIDPKRVELTRYNQVPHLYGHVESDAERIVGVLHWLVREMQERYKKLARVGARHVDVYNRLWRVGSQEYMPRIVVLVDELADLMFFAPEEVEKSICRLAQMARATGIHLVIATQRPSVDVVTGLIKANFPARIAFAVSSNVDSRVILDALGAETLLSNGDMLYMSPDSSKLVRAQGVLVSEGELERLIQYWEEWAASETWEKEPCPWDAALEEGQDADGDDLLQQAIEIVREQGGASASLLQRRMRIGYPRASRLIDDMERLGIIGPAQRGGRPREVLGMD
jgi:S-DNA-T family DNA segregation ATPase FtsK/SpoIIIE